MNNQLHSFTPVRRRDYYTHAQTLDHDDSNNWTTSRCNRLLRPLISRIATLQRVKVGHISESKGEVKGIPTVLGDAEDTVKDDGSDSDEWAPARKRARRTYSKHSTKRQNLNGKRSKNAHDQNLQVPGEYILPTPVLDYVAYQERASVDQTSEPDSNQQIHLKNIRGRPSLKDKRPNPRYMTNDGAAHFQISEDLRAIRKSTRPDTYRAYEGIFHSLETILKTTTPVRVPPKTGSKSLLSMCLRRVPEYIAEEELVEKEKIQEDGPTPTFEVDNISTEIYTDLENVGASTNGWKHLRTVVRSHAIYYIREAIQKGFMDMKFATVLVDLCVHMKAQEEAQDILSVLLQVQYPEPQSIQSIWPDDQLLSNLTALDKFADYTGAHSIQYRQLTSLFSTQLLPSRWLATRRFGPLWTRAFRLASHESYDQEATTFLSTVIPMLCESSAELELEYTIVRSDVKELSQASMATLTSILATLSAIITLRRGNIESRGIPDRFTRILQASMSQLRTMHSQVSSERAIILIIANMIAQPKAYSLNKHYTTLIRTCASPRTIRHVSTFLVSIVRCCRRASTQSADPGYLETLHSVIRDRLPLFTEDVHTLSAEILINSASMMSKHDAKYSKYAKSLKAEFHDSVRKELGVEMEGEGESCFRWEEGISEWVTATPALPLKVRPLHHQFEDSEDESPIRPRSGRPKNLLLRRSHTTPSRPPPMKRPQFSMERDHLGLSSPIDHDSSSHLRSQNRTAMERFNSHEASGAVESQETDDHAASLTKSSENSRVGSLSMIMDESDDELNSSGLTFDDSEDEMDTSAISTGSKRPFMLCTKMERRRRSVRVAGSEDELGY